MNTNSVYKDLIWSVFEKTGEISSFLEYKQFETINKGENNDNAFHERLNN